jgi:hypothetical protein
MADTQESLGYSVIHVPHWFESVAELPSGWTEPQSITQPLSRAARHYVVVLASGPEDASKRATLAFSAACTALSLDLDTQVFLIDYGSR